MNYSPKIYTGEHFSEIFSEILFKNNTIGKGLVRVLDNIKYETQVTTLSGTIAIQDYKTLLTSADSNDTFNFGDATVRPVKKMAYSEFTFEDLRSTRFSKDMASGAANMESDEFLKNVLAFAEARISRGMEEQFWAGVLGKLAVSGATAPVKVTGVALTASNLKTEFGKVYAAIPDVVLAEGDVKIFADHSIFKLVNQANLAETYRDIFTVVNGEHYYLGIKIEYVPLGANKMVAGRASDIIWATDLVSDLGQIEVNKVQNNSDKMFIKSVFTLDQAVVVPTQKVFYA